MLVLTGICRESVGVGGMQDVEPVLRVMVPEIRGTKVRRGFEATRGVSIHRSKLWERIPMRQAAAPTAP
jgi:sRNA-binding carbon storage regulator CsrA